MRQYVNPIRKDVSIRCPDITGKGTTIEINQQLIDLVTDIQVTIPLDGAPKVRIERYLSGLEIVGKFDVDEVIVIPGRPGKRYRLFEIVEDTEVKG